MAHQEVTLAEASVAALQHLPASDRPPRTLRIVWSDQGNPLLVEVHFQDNSEACYMDARFTAEPPVPYSLVLPLAPPGNLSISCRADILEVLRAADHRMVAREILNALLLSGHEWSPRAITGQLARLVREGILDNPGAGRNREGYAIVQK